MKKVKFSGRFVALFMACMMMIAMPVSAFAEEPVVNNSRKIEIVVGPHETTEIDLQQLLDTEDYVTTTVVAPGETGSGEGYMGSYIGLYKTVHFSAIYCGKSGTVQCVLANSDGYDSSTSCNLTASKMNQSKNIWGAHSGNYRLTVYNGSSANCAVVCYW